MQHLEPKSTPGCCLPKIGPPQSLMGGTQANSTQSLSSTLESHRGQAQDHHLCYGLLCVFPEIALQKLNEQKDIFTLGDWLVPALMGKRDVKSIWRKIQDHGWWQNDRNLYGF